MNSQKLFLFLLLSFAYELSESRCTADRWPVGEVSYQRVDPSLRWFIKSKFPEKSQPDAAVTIDRPYLYTVTSENDIHITFLNSGGGMPSSLSYYVHADEGEQEIKLLWPDQSCARVGDTIAIGHFAKGTLLGFKLTTAPQNGTYPIASPTFWSSPTNGFKNSDNISHVSYVLFNRYPVVGFEDLMLGGDKDFNDIMFSIREVEPLSSCPTDVCSKSFLDGDLGKILAIATGLAVVVERIVESLWCVWAMVVCRWRHHYHIRQEETQFAIHQFLTLGAAATLARVRRFGRFRAGVLYRLNVRIVLSVIMAVLIGLGLAHLANAIFPLCWCPSWVTGVGVFAGFLTPFLHQLIELAFRAQRYLKDN